MKRILLFVTILSLSMSTRAQDIIVLHDGTAILSKILEVNPDNVKYKKHSNQNGPTFTILKSDIRSINYQNGEKDVFDNNTSTALTNSKNTSDAVKKTKEEIYINDAVITNHNDRDVRYVNTKNNKKVKWIYRLIRIHTESTMANTDCKVTVFANDRFFEGIEKTVYSLAIENTTNEIMYVDLGSSSFRQLKKASTYYVNSSTTRSSSNGGGASINLGSIASVLGIGGAIGTLAAGTSVGGNKSSGTSTTYYSERIITIPPHSKYTFSDKPFYDQLISPPYNPNYTFGQRKRFQQPNDFINCPWEFIISYAMGSDLNTTKKLDVGLYVSEEIAVDSSNGKHIEKERDLEPIHYYHKTK